MGVLVLFAWVVLASAAPDAMPSWLSIDRHAPDLFVALTAYLALRADGHGVVRWGIVLGLAKDCVSLDPLGTHAFVLGTVAYLLARRRSPASEARGASRALLTGAAELLAHVLYLLRSLPLHRGGPGLSALPAGFPIALWTALQSWPLFALLDRTRVLDDLAGRRAHGFSA